MSTSSVNQPMSRKDEVVQARYGVYRAHLLMRINEYLYSPVQVFLLQCLVLVDGRLQLGPLIATNAQRPCARGCIDAQSHMHGLRQYKRGVSFA